MSSDSRQKNVERFMGFADTYDSARPQPSPAMVDLLTQLAQVDRPRLVVDLGCGTGLSTRVWIGRSEKIIGIEPSSDMRSQAVAATPPGAVEYREGFSHDMGLSDGCADIVTCCQCLHWMEPEPTFGEIARVLRDGGVFAACDYDWLPTMGNWQAEQACIIQREKAREIQKRTNFSDGSRQWNKDQHLSRIRDSGCFRYTKEVLLHSREQGNAGRIVAAAESFGQTSSMLKAGFTKDELGLTQLRHDVERLVGDKPLPWWISYRVRIGIK